MTFYQDLEKIAYFLCGLSYNNITSNFSLPKELVLNETSLYGICFDLDIETTFLSEYDNCKEATVHLLSKFENEVGIEKFINYILNQYIDNNTMKLVENGYDIFLIKSEFIRTINALWSVPNQEFVVQSDGSYILDTVRFKEYDKLGRGGFCTIYKGSDNCVYKVLNTIEKSSQSSVHRFKREFLLMEEHNGSGFTIDVFDYEQKSLVYSMERAQYTLEHYIGSKTLSEEEKDNIILRCVECMKYLHSKNVVHRDFHPGNIMLNYNNKWVVTDFGLAKSYDAEYSRTTKTTHDIGRFWFTDPVQLEALKEGSYNTDLYSLAKTIDYIFNGDKSQRPNKYSTIIHKATSPDDEMRYENIYELENDVINVINREKYESPREIVAKIIQQYNQEGEFNVIDLSNILDSDDGMIFWDLVISYKNDFSEPFVNLVRINYDLGVRLISNFYDYMREQYHPWQYYDIAARWAGAVLKIRANSDDEVSDISANIVEYVAENVNRYDIKSLSNRLKKDVNINSYIRSKLTYHDGY